MRIFHPNTLAMTLLQFCSLSGDLQRQVVQQRGVFLFGRTGIGITAKLYQVEGFYVEIFFDHQRSGVSSMVPFDDANNLEPYLRQVDIMAIYELLS